MRTWIDKGQVKDRAHVGLSSSPPTSNADLVFPCSYGPFPEEGDSMPSLLLGQVIASKAEQYKELRVLFILFLPPTSAT